MFATSFSVSRRRLTASTLIETMAAMVILGGLVVGIVVAAGRLTVQSGLANERLKACRLADGLLESWWAEPENIPTHGAGTFTEEPAWRWRTNVIQNHQTKPLHAEVIGLEIFAPDKRAGVEMTTANETTALRIEILLPRKEP